MHLIIKIILVIHLIIHLVILNNNNASNKHSFIHFFKFRNLDISLGEN